MDFSEWLGLAATTFAAALLYAVSGFGFAVLAAPLYLLFTAPAQAIQLVIIISTALAIIVVPGLRRSVAPMLLLRLTLGSVAGLPVGLAAFRLADPVLVRVGVGITICGFATLIAATFGRLRRRWAPLAMTPGRDLGAGLISGIATAMVGMAGPPVLIYLLLAQTSAATVRATLLAFFALSYGATLLSHALTIGIPGSTWLAALMLIPAAILGGLAGRPIGDRLAGDAFTMLATALLAAAGLYTLAAASVELTARHQ